MEAEKLELFVDGVRGVTKLVCRSPNASAGGSDV